MNGISCWNGTTWTPLTGSSGTGVAGTVLDLAVWDEGFGKALYVAGTFATAGGLEANGVARWNGTEWEGLSGPSGIGLGGFGFNPQAWALQVYQDGTSQSLFVAGHFVTAGGLRSVNMGRWGCEATLFGDGFESSDTSRWQATSP